MENYLFLENYVTSEEAVSHKVFFKYQQLSITRYQVVITNSVQCLLSSWKVLLIWKCYKDSKSFNGKKIIVSNEWLKETVKYLLSLEADSL